MSWPGLRPGAEPRYAGQGMTRIRHVANGHCTTRLIEAAGLPGRVSLWADALHDGPGMQRGERACSLTDPAAMPPRGTLSLAP